MQLNNNDNISKIKEKKKDEDNIILRKAIKKNYYDLIKIRHTQTTLIKKEKPKEERENKYKVLKMNNTNIKK